MFRSSRVTLNWTPTPYSSVQFTPPPNVLQCAISYYSASNSFLPHYFLLNTERYLPWKIVSKKKKDINGFNTWWVESGLSEVVIQVDCVWNVMAYAQKPDFVFWQNGRVHLNRQGRQFSWLLAAEVCASAVVMLDTPFSEVVWRVLATHSILQFPLHLPSHASCIITFQLDSKNYFPSLPWSLPSFIYPLCPDILIFIT